MELLKRKIDTILLDWKANIFSETLHERESDFRDSSGWWACRTTSSVTLMVSL